MDTSQHNSNSALKIIDGRLVRADRKQKLIADIKQLSFVPCLAIVQIGDRVDSTTFINAKKKFALEIGVKEMHVHMKENVGQDEVVEQILKLNQDENIHGIIVQLPLPAHLDRDAVIRSIQPKKDVDGLTPDNISDWISGKTGAILPATARGIGELFDYYKIDLAGKNVVVVGRSMLVGKPVATMCQNRNATVTICHSKTINLQTVTKEADIIIVAIGKPNWIGLEHVREGQIVIDIGINSEGGKLVGDVDFDVVAPIVSMITPVPGGVGQMTVLALFENLFDACYTSKIS